MLKQSESLHLHTRPKHWVGIRTLILLIAFSLSTELNAQHGSPSSQYHTELGTPSPWLTPLDLIVDWPYTQEVKQSMLEQQSVERVLKLAPLKSDKITTIIPSLSTLWPKLPENPEVGYNEFVARRTATDQERITHQDSLKALAACLWYRPTEFYLTYQDLSYYLQDWWSWTIYTIPLSLFEQIKKRQEQYNINPKIWIQSFIDKHKYPKWKPSVQPNPNSEPEPLRLPKAEEMFRKNPWVETTKYGKTSLQVYRYDRKTAAQLLIDLWCRFWSTNLQDEETGQWYTSWYTSVEWITQDCIDWITTLIETLKNKWIETPNLYINWATEWYDHWMGNKIIAWNTKLGTVLSEKHAKAHGSWFTVDIRLEGQEAIELKKMFPWTRGSVQIWSTIYAYYFHGKGKNHHLHCNIFSKKHYTTLYGALKK